jgi:hypothetical protein
VEHGADLTAEVDLSRRAERTDLHDDTQRAEVERTVCQVPGVVGARLVPGYQREVDELHVLTTVDRAPKQTVRDVQTLLMARYGVTTDHRVVSVAQIDAPQGLPSSSRVIVERVGLSQSGVTVTAEVAVRDGDQTLVGTGEGPSSSTGQWRATARATLDALRPLLGDRSAIELEGTDLSDVLGRKVAITIIHFRTERGELTVAGSALVRDSEPDAVARSVLDALNRTIAEAAAAQ